MITHTRTAVLAHQLPRFPPSFLHPDPEQPFLSRRESGQAKGNVLETIFMTRSSSHLIVPCLVTVPDLNVTLHAVCSRRRWPPAPPNLEVASHSVSFCGVVSVPHASGREGGHVGQQAGLVHTPLGHRQLAIALLRLLCGHTWRQRIPVC